MSLSRSLMYYFQVRSLNSSHQTLHFRHMNFYFFQRTQISLNRFLSIFGSFQLCFLLFFLKIRVFILLLFLSEDVDLPESFYFFQRTQISLNFLLPFDWRVVSQRPQESTREGVLVKCHYLPIYFSSQIKYHILWIFVVYTQ